MKYLKKFESTSASSIEEIVKKYKDFVFQYDEFLELAKNYPLEKWTQKEVDSLKELNYGKIASASFMEGDVICNKREDNNYLLMLYKEGNKYHPTCFRFDFFGELYGVLIKLKVNI
jgi:hypothetical protein